MIITRIAVYLAAAPIPTLPPPGPDDDGTGSELMSPSYPSPRRQFLFGLGALCASSVVAARPATAFQVVPTDDYADMVEHSCGVNSYHQRLLDEAAARLGVTLTKEQRAQALAALKCPFCGCPLITAALTSDPPTSATP